MPAIALSQLAVQIPDCRFDGNGLDPLITGVAALDRAAPGELTFLSSAKYQPLLQTTQAGAAILDLETPCSLPCLRTANPRLAFARAIALFYQPIQLPSGIHPTAIVGEDVHLGDGVAIGAGAVIGDRVRLGDRVQIFPNATLYADVAIAADSVVHANCVIYSGTRIGTACIIHAGTAIGCDGFGYELLPDGTWFKIPQSGYVVIGDRVEIGCLTAIDRPSVGFTEIRTGAKLDNLIQIGHGCQVGEHDILVSQVGMAGGVKLGHHVILAGQVGIADHVTVGDGVIVGAKSGIPSDVEPGVKVMGYPIVLQKDWKRIAIAERQLPDLLHTVRKLEKRIAELEAKLAPPG